MKKTLIILAGAISYIAVSLILTSYGNYHSHPSLNESIVDVFLSRFQNSSDPHDTFYNYDFKFNLDYGMNGEEITKGGLFVITKKQGSYNAKNWIRHGGFSADEPEIRASLRHFYDPTQPPGERYLKNLAYDISLAYDIVNPQVDHVEWGIYHPEHEYNYENAKDHFSSALETSDSYTRDALMAFAWRALGETLHLIADMGIPCHVRDDSHPAILAQHTSWFGDPDPYEEICEAIAKKDGINTWLTGSVDPAVELFTMKAKTAQEIAGQLAAYTNANFFSNQTIYGDGWVPRIHRYDYYPSPNLDDCIYDPKRSLYLKEIGFNTVYMCKDFSYLRILNGFHGYPYIDKECVISQIKALAPQIVESGVNVMRCFIPKLEVKIVEISNGTMKGEVNHITNEEYPLKINYEGPVVIRKVSNEEEIATVSCSKGKIDSPISLSGFDFENDNLFAEIECGGVIVRSEPYEAPLYRKVEVLFTSVDGSLNFLIGKYLWSDEIVFGITSIEKPLKWDNASFSADYGDPQLGNTETTIGSLSDDLKLLEYIQISYEAVNDGYHVKKFVHLSNVKMEESHGRLVSVIPDGQGKQYIQSWISEGGKVGEEPFASIVDDWSNTRVSVIFSNY